MIITDKILSKLQEPISEEEFCGKYLKLDRQAFRAIRNIYNEANSTARKLLQTPDESELDELLDQNKSCWNRLAETISTSFQEQTKDIEILSWLLVSQLYVDDSMVGFKNGLSLLKFLVVEHWDSLNPIIASNADSDDAKKKEITEFKLQSFSQMVGEGENDSILYAPLSQVKLIGSTNYFAYQSAERKGECQKLRDDLRKEVSENSDKYKNLIETLKECKNLLTETYKSVLSVGEPLGLSVPSFHYLINHVDKMLNVVGFITGFGIESEAAQVEANVVEAATNVNTVDNATNNTSAVATNANVVSAPQVVNVVVPQGTVVNNSQTLNLLSKNGKVTREQIFDELQSIATYFKNTEPHSPVSFLIEKAIRWGHMSLPELLDEMISDQQDARNRIFTIAGLGEGLSFSGVAPTNNVNQVSGASQGKTNAQSAQNEEVDNTQINW